VITLSALTTEGADLGVKALQLGAIDQFLKPSVSSSAGFDGAKEPMNKIKTATRPRVSRQTKYGEEPAQFVKLIRRPHLRQSLLNRVVVIGSSTGGPCALSAIVPALPEDIPASILIVQHMSPRFTKTLAERLSNISRIELKEAQDNDSVTPAVAFLGPGGYHMTVDRDGRIRLNQRPPECGVRPSVNVTMKSAAEIYGASTLGIVLTGMGWDGVEGASCIKAAGSRVIVEDESTCAIYGMSQSVVKAGYADKIVLLHEMASELARICKGD
jgi:two-component system chemotaxis response regulator CheB